MYKLLLIFIGIPLIEMIILVKMGEALGFWTTVGIVILTGVLGAFLARIEGWRAWANLKKEVNSGGMPERAMMDAVIILIAGVMLIMPGILTDIFGFMLLVPWIRTKIMEWLQKKIEKRHRTYRTHRNFNNPTFPK